MVTLSTRCTAVLVLTCAMPVRGLWNQSHADTLPPRRPLVAELFTSQGCSSCPPADALLGELAANHEVIALGYHVDYWDGLGWRDRFSMPEATARQHRYVDALRLSSAFTPQLVIDGRLSLVGSDRQGITAALLEAPTAVAIGASVLPDELVISLPNGTDRRPYEVSIIAYMPQSTTRIGNGENGGRTLTDFNIVRQIRRLGAWDGKASTFRVPLTSFPTDASRVAVLVQQPNEGPIVGAIAMSLCVSKMTSSPAAGAPLCPP